MFIQSFRLPIGINLSNGLLKINQGSLLRESKVLINRFYATERLTVKPLESRKTFLMDYYKDMMESNPVILFVHYNNLMKQENEHYRSLIKSNGGKLSMLRNNLFKAYLRAAHTEDPSAPIQNKDKNMNHPLLPLFNGPTAAIMFKETSPANVAKIVKLLEKAQDKLFIVGAKVETEVYDVAQLNEFKKLPSKPELQAQLLGLLHILSGAGLVNTLEKGSQTLYLTLKSHHDNKESQGN
ncbi:hypothetical protein Kpol_269p7 [Vanderwaltozyma polyspora DSM 70294]|uniref:Ribosomal protein L10 n=1 Tax=Vanderwaltozyma polyspora (strain ATCC 22028 / DSM 70294 / BCRC 21397 / CBS 2163 / NBRC 10782 / NRRL Y-8283 / UCD 57-17) TaxID=436907 RepID=A7TT37_VANPO|nr:uncharacterized protein Kpol_269p7 [Vanderwaltozyma polyspora DSM 70294]EDO14573.1 hypothetical protein Kpol_269p7 [Vanderwaltozyma polyspora DSM 70294]